MTGDQSPGAADAAGKRTARVARTSTTGTVHVVGYRPDSYWVPLPRRESPEAAAILGLLSSPRRMLCGTRLLVSSVDGQQAVWAADRLR